MDSVVMDRIGRTSNETMLELNEMNAMSRMESVLTTLPVKGGRKARRTVTTFWVPTTCWFVAINLNVDD